MRHAGWAGNGNSQVPTDDIEPARPSLTSTSKPFLREERYPSILGGENKVPDDASC